MANADEAWAACQSLVSLDCFVMTHRMVFSKSLDRKPTWYTDRTEDAESSMKNEKNLSNPRNPCPKVL